MGTVRKADGTDNYQFHASAEMSGRYILYPRGQRDKAVVYTPQIAKDVLGQPSSPAFLTSEQIDTIGAAVFTDG